MDTIKAFARYLGLLLPGLWGAIGVVRQSASIIAFLATSSALIASIWIPQLGRNRWLVYVLLVAAVLVSGFRLWQNQLRELQQLQKENERLREELEDLKQPRVDPEAREWVKQRWPQLKEEEKEAIRLLILHETLTEDQALEFLHKKGMALNWGRVFEQIAARTNLVERVEAGRQPHEHVKGYLGRYQITPKFKQPLEEVTRQH